MAAVNPRGRRRSLIGHGGNGVSQQILTEPAMKNRAHRPRSVAYAYRRDCTGTGVVVRKQIRSVNAQTTGSPKATLGTAGAECQWVRRSTRKLFCGK
jgi:hypothetical protein